MKIIYITTAMEEGDYNAFVTQWTVALNPAKQSFNLKLIKALSENNEIEVFSIRPFSRTLCQIYYLDRAFTEEKNIKWHYLAIPRYRVFKYPACKSQTLDILKTMDLTDTVVLTETINPICLHVANAIQDTYKLPVVGIVTESPSNIKNTSKDFSLRIFKMGQRFDGYLALTSGLNTVFNPNNKPSLIFEGIVNNEFPPRITNEFGRYIYFTGALQESSGIYQLIEAFKNIEDPTLRLLISGHHADMEKLNNAIESDSRIVNVGMVNNKKSIQLEMNALINIDPRPYSEDLDRFSIPDNLVEYLDSGVTTISVKNSRIKKHFPENVIWSKSGETPYLYECITKVLSLTDEERENIGKSAKQKAQELYSQQKIADSINKFLKEIVK